MGFGSRVKALRAVAQKQVEFKATVKNMLDDPEMEEAHGLISQVQRLFDSGMESLLRSSHQMGTTIHTNDMQSDSALWARSDNRWGQGSGYRSDVVRFHEEWFENHRDSLEPKVQSLVEREVGEAAESHVGAARVRVGLLHRTLDNQDRTSRIST